MNLSELINTAQAILKTHGDLEVGGQWAELDGNGCGTTRAFLLDVAEEDGMCMITLGPHERDIALYRSQREHQSRDQT